MKCDLRLAKLGFPLRLQLELWLRLEPFQPWEEVVVVLVNPTHLEPR